MKITYSVILFVILFLATAIAGTTQTVNTDSLFTPEEIDWLDNNRYSIRYSPHNSWPPGEFIEEGLEKGFIQDYLHLFEDMAGIKFQMVHYNTWAQSLLGLQNNETDLIGTIHKTPERAEYLLFTQPVKHVELGIITRSDYGHKVTHEHIPAMKLVCTEGYSSADYILEEYPDAQLRFADDDIEALLDVSIGRADGAVIDYMTASYLVEKYGLTNLHYATGLDFSWDISFACRKDLPELHSILEKLMKAIPEKTHKEISNRWIGLSINQKSFVEVHAGTIAKTLLFVVVILLV